MSIIGKNIRYLRKKSKISQSRLGKLVNKSESTIQMWETGYRSPTMGSVKTLSEVFNVDINSLMEIDMQINNIKEANIYNDANISFIKVPLYSDISCGKGSFVDDNIIDYIPRFTSTVSSIVPTSKPASAAAARAIVSIVFFIMPCFFLSLLVSTNIRII